MTDIETVVLIVFLLNFLWWGWWSTLPDKDDK